MKKNIVLGIVIILVGAVFIPNVSGDFEDDIANAIEIGIEWLVDQQGEDGSWNAYDGAYEAGTGLALYKLCERAYELGYESPFDPSYKYSENVSAGFNWTFDHLYTYDIDVQDHTTGASGTMDDPDTNGNGIGLCAGPDSYRETYYTGILLTGIAASRTPSRVVDVPGSPVDGWTYEDVVQDLVDFLAFGQVEYPVPDIMYEGGWEYFHMDNGAYGSGWMGDQSNSGYAVLGLAEAEVFGATIPNWVKTELNVWIDWVQDDINSDTNDGGSWYSFPGDSIGVNTYKTGNLLTQMALVGDTPSTPRVMDAIDYIERHWYDASGINAPPGWNGNPAQYQAMFGLMKGLVYIGIDSFNGIDWFYDIATVILDQQVTTPGLNYGSWQASSGRGDPILITIWALLTLEKIAPPPQITYSVDKVFRYTSVDWVNQLLYKDFSDCMNGWTVDPEHPNNWGCEYSNYAGGMSPEIRFNYTPVFEGDSWFMSPQINTEGLTAMKVSFKHFVDDYSVTTETYEIGLEASPDEGITWYTVYSQVLTNDLGPETVTVIVPSMAIGSETTYLRFYFIGDSWDINYWYIDDVEVYGNAIISEKLPQDIDDYYLVDVVYKGHKVKSTNPGALYGAINITGPGNIINITDTFDTFFDVHQAKTGVKIIVLDDDGFAEEITDYPGVEFDVDNTANIVTVDINLTEAIGSPLPNGYQLLVYVKFTTALKGEEWPCSPSETFENYAVVEIDDIEEPFEAFATVLLSEK